LEQPDQLLLVLATFASHQGVCDPTEHLRIASPAEQPLRTVDAAVAGVLLVLDDESIERFVEALDRDLEMRGHLLLDAEAVVHRAVRLQARLSEYRIEFAGVGRLVVHAHAALHGGAWTSGGQILSKDD